MNLFLEAAKQKLRFTTNRGQVSVEQLFEMPLTAKDGFSLDMTARSINNSIKEAGDESFVSSGKNPATTELTLKLEVVKAVIADREADNAAKIDYKAKQAELAQLEGLLASAEQAELAKLSKTELEARIKALKS